MNANQLYRVCIKSGTLQQIPTFRVKIGKAQKKINPYFIPSNKQRYNCDSILQRYNNQEFLTLSVFYAYKFIGSGSIHFDRPQMPNQKVQIFDRDKKSIAFIDCSLIRIKKVVQVPSLDITVQFVKFDEIGPKDMTGSPFVVLKYGELNYQTQKQPLYSQDKQYIFNESFKFPQSEMERIIVQFWCEFKQTTKFLGVSLVYLTQKQFINREKEFDISLLGKKIGKIKVGVFEDKQGGNKKDYSNAPKRTLKTTVNEAIMINPITTGTYIKMKVGTQFFETTTLFVEKSTISWNQSFTMQVNSEKQQLQVFMIVKEKEQKMVGRAFLEVSKVSNRMYELTFLDQNQTDIGKIFIQFYDHELYNKQRKHISKQLAQKIANDLSSIKKRYENKPLHQYLQQLNVVLQQGILDVSKKNPKNPLKDLGQYLLAYRKNNDKKN